MVGTALRSHLSTLGHECVSLVREETDGEDGIPWNPAEGQLDPNALQGFDAVVCLSGADISKGRWTEARKRELRSSRVDTVRLLAETMAGLDDGPRALVCASAIGYYGAHNGDRILEDDAPAGDDFLAGICVDWEAAADPARAAGIRVAHLRLGVVLDGSDGMLGKVAPVFRLGLGGRLGKGDQYMSWIAINDAVRAFAWAVENTGASGAYNATAPEPVTNAQFTEALGAVLHRPAILPAPAFALRLALGQMGEDLLLGSTRAVPKRLSAEGFDFEHPSLEAALRAIL